MTAWLTHFIDLFIESAPWLLLGITIAGLIKVFIPEDFLVKHLGSASFSSIIKAALIGAPLPLCSCGVIPAALGLRRAGASKSSTTSFLISTPETGVDSIAITYAFMGPFMAITRPIVAIISAIIAGIAVKYIDPSDNALHTQKDNETNSACCAPKAEEPSCCASDSTPKQSQTVIQKLQYGLQFAFTDLVKDIAFWLLVGLILAGAIQAFIPIEWLTQWGNGWMAFLVMALIGVPMYICATSSTPIAAALLFSGVSPGAVLVFMLVGPATNIATLRLVQKELGNRSLSAYLSSIIGVAFISGWLVNLMAQKYDFIALETSNHTMEHGYVAIALSVLLAALIVRGLYMDWQERQQGHSHG